MRPFGLLLATCLCTVLLYDRLAGRFRPPYSRRHPLRFPQLIRLTDRKPAWKNFNITRCSCGL